MTGVPSFLSYIMTLRSRHITFFETPLFPLPKILPIPSILVNQNNSSCPWNSSSRVGLQEAPSQDVSEFQKEQRMPRLSSFSRDEDRAVTTSTEPTDPGGCPLIYMFSKKHVKRNSVQNVSICRVFSHKGTNHQRAADPWRHAERGGETGGEAAGVNKSCHDPV